MHPLIKILIGIVFLVVPLGLYANELLFDNPISLPVIGELNLLRSLLIIIQGMVPPFVMLIGLFIIWLELDEWKIEKELKREEEKEEEEKKNKKKKK